MTHRSILPPRLSRALVSGPVALPAVVVIQMFFVIASGTPRAVPLGAVPDRVSRHGDMDFPILPTDGIYPVWRYQHFLAQPPIAGIDHQIADAPGLVIDDEVVHVADRVVAPLNVVASDLLGAAFRLRNMVRSPSRAECFRATSLLNLVHDWVHIERPQPEAVVISARQTSLYAAGACVTQFVLTPARAWQPTTRVQMCGSCGKSQRTFSYRSAKHQRRRSRLCRPLVRAALRAAAERPAAPFVFAALRDADERSAAERRRAAEWACRDNAFGDAALCPSRVI